MYKKGILIGLIIVLSCFMTSAITCYQESANKSNSCGGLSTGLYSSTASAWSGTHIGELAYDEDYSTYAGVDHPQNANIFVNWTKPTIIINATPSSNFTFKMHNGYINVTPTASCWNWSSIISLRVFIEHNGDLSYIYCRNDTDWDLIRGQAGIVWDVYEEGASWYTDNIIYRFNLTDSKAEITPSCSVDYGTINEDNIYTWDGSTSTINLTCSMAGMTRFSQSVNVMDLNKWFNVSIPKLNLTFSSKSNTTITALGGGDIHM